MASRPALAKPHARRTPMFATCVPGLGRMLRRHLAAVVGIEVTGTGYDGRADLVFFDADLSGRAEALHCRIAEDVFAEVGRANRAGGGLAAGVASMAWQPDAAQRALSVWAAEVRPLSGSMTFRVTARVRSETRFRRTGLRQAMTGVIGAHRPRWRAAAPAQLEVVISEWHDGQYVCGLRIASPWQRGLSQRPEAVRPTAAAAMVWLAGPPAGTLLDPCCGYGAVLAEAMAAGWLAEGTDPDPAAVAAAAGAAAGAHVELGDARALLLADDSIEACASALPFWRQPQPSGPWQDWTAAALAEMSRVTRSGGPVVLLAPELPRLLVPGTLRLRKQVPVRLSGAAPSIWLFRRA